MVLYKKDLDRIDEICGYLDCDIWGKRCNFIQYRGGGDCLLFYNRDFCKEITFKELIKWYLPRYSSLDDEEEDDYEIFYKRLNEKTDMLMELIDFYFLYRTVDE